jgi:hypothetical protein
VNIRSIDGPSTGTLVSRIESISRGIPTLIETRFIDRASGWRSGAL